MKKFWSGLLIICLLLVFSGCSSNEADNLTMDKFIEAFNNSGEDVNHDVDSGVEKGINREKKPKYEMIDAKDGIIFNIGTNTVKLYEYETNAKAKKAIEKYNSIMQDWPVKGKIVLETNNAKAKEIFNSVE
ncbi:hypothetical protein R70723_06725 [Paenibacillus sp. FSL R7-0273]|uniref:hypothetical protein n=1 Tax=Paenibacillus sp. FSL R7-0273 TaxID=1536772 RepID=UPI0004F7EFF2|nr:hypothetical protein [Paenibacillus sp. FSL R7-0273]AIQ45622.1 hypothetical protein R70723_06725 [Paenibacillus sp. FSL R7-0273]OMF95141.1 hypothetical protein BK144_06285 [Paenibacillus sp. FSL R7-0273]